MFIMWYIFVEEGTSGDTNDHYSEMAWLPFQKDLRIYG